MIKIHRLPAPAELTPQVVAEKTAIYRADSEKHVWKEAYIKNRLLEMSHKKCCYCEVMLEEKSRYMEVEHFHDKHDYPDEVVVWDNLLPSCKTCNDNKGTHDTIADPIVDPSVVDPRDYLGFRDYAYKEKNSVGKETYVTLGLNDTEKHCVPRYRVCKEMKDKVEGFIERVKNLVPTSRTQVKNKLRNDVVELLEACQCDREYTAIKATMMVNNPDYLTLIKEMKACGIWNSVLESLDQQMRVFVMDLL